MKSNDKYIMQYEGNFLHNHIHYINGKKDQFRICNGGSRGYADEIATRILKLLRNDAIRVKNKATRPKNYRPIKDILLFIGKLKRGKNFYMGSIDGYYEGKFVKYENKTLYYTMVTDNPVVSTTKIHKVMLHRIKFIKHPLNIKNR